MKCRLIDGIQLMVGASMCPRVGALRGEDGEWLSVDLLRCRKCRYWDGFFWAPVKKHTLCWCRHPEALRLELDRLRGERISSSVGV